MASGLSIGDDYCSALSVHYVNRAFDDRHWGVPKFSIGLKLDSHLVKALHLHHFAPGSL